LLPAGAQVCVGAAVEFSHAIEPGSSLILFVSPLTVARAAPAALAPESESPSDTPRTSFAVEVLALGAGSTAVRRAGTLLTTESGVALVLGVLPKPPPCPPSAHPPRAAVRR
jgi:hypothetical protein